MTKTSDNIKYSPSLSIAENAKRNGVNEDAIRYYIRTRGVDRRYEEKKKELKAMIDEKVQFRGSKYYTVITFDDTSV